MQSIDGDVRMGIVLFVDGSRYHGWRVGPTLSLLNDEIIFIDPELTQAWNEYKQSLGSD